MASLQCDVHALTAREEVQVRDTDFSAFKYQDKSGSRGTEGRPYAEDKITFATGRGQVVRLDNKRPLRLRSSLKELEDGLAEHAVVSCRWRGPRLVQLTLSSGLVASLWVSKLGDVERIQLDKWLVGKLGDHVTDLQHSPRLLAVAYLEARLTIVTFGKASEGRGELLASLEPRLLTVELPGPPGRRLDRKLEVSADGARLLVWWSTGGQEVFPWAPSLREEDRANLVLVTVRGERGEQPTVTSCCRTGGEPLYCRFLQDSTVHCLAQSQASGARRGETKLENSILNLEHGKHLRRKIQRSVIVSNVVICHALIPHSDNVLLGTVDGAIFTFDQVENRVDNQVKAGFTASSLVCHPEGAVFLALSEKGLVQCFDTALTPVQLCFPNEEQVTSNVLDLTPYFRSAGSLRGGCWSVPPAPAAASSTGASMAFNLFLLRWQGGPLALLRLNAGVYTGGRMGPLQLVAQYLKLHLYHQVLLFLSSLSWSYSGHSLLLCLATAFNAFLKLPYTRDKECLLEMCLGVFHTPARPITEDIREEYGEAVRDLTRRFFHHLVRHNQLVKGFQLAVDINDYDLFMDIHHAAVRRQVPDLAHAALIKAKTAYNRLDSDSGSRAGSRQSAAVPSPLTLFAAAVEQEQEVEGMVMATMRKEYVGEEMQPGRTATYLRTTAAKKISTHKFRGAELDEATAVAKSLKYESIVPLPPEGGQLVLPPSSPYLFRSSPGEQFVTNLSTEGGEQGQYHPQEREQDEGQYHPQNRDQEQGQYQPQGKYLPQVREQGQGQYHPPEGELEQGQYSQQAREQDQGQYLLGREEGHGQYNPQQGQGQYYSQGLEQGQYYPQGVEGSQRPRPTFFQEEEEEEDGVDGITEGLEQTHMPTLPSYQPPPGAYHLAPPYHSPPSMASTSFPGSYQEPPPIPTATYPGNRGTPSYPPTPSYPASTSYPQTPSYPPTPSYQPSQPPSYQPPPSLPRQQQEDIKVIHFGVV